MSHVLRHARYDGGYFYFAVENGLSFLIARFSRSNRPAIANTMRFSGMSLFTQIVYTLKELRGLDSCNSYFPRPIVRTISSIGALPRVMQVSIPDN